MLTKKDPNGHITQYEYDSPDRNTKITDAAGNPYVISYDAMGRVISVTDQEGAQTFYIYNSLGQLTEVKDALGHSRKQRYDLLGRVTEYTDQNRASTLMEYSPNGNLLRITGPDGGVTEYTYDSMDRVLTEKTPLGALTSYTYDALGRVVSSTDGNGHTTSFTYDAVSRIQTVTDPAGSVTSYEYDGNGNVIRTTDANGSQVTYEYDPLNNMTSMALRRSDAVNGVSESETTLYRYNQAGQLIETVNPANLSKRFAYDASGNLSSTTDEDGFITRNTYDERNYLKSTTYSDGRQALYVYNKTGQLAELTDWNGTTSFVYDAEQRLQEVTDHNNRTTRYQYDPAGNITGMTYPDGSTVSYSYNRSNQITRVTASDGQVTGYTYDAGGNILSQSNHNGDVTWYEYDSIGQLLKATEYGAGKVRQINTYAYDERGNIISDTQDSSYKPLNKNRSYEYDALSRLVSFTENGTTTQYVYDSLGNLTKETAGGQATIYTYNNLNQLTTKTTSASVFAYRYDRRGNLTGETKDGSPYKSYVYDATNHMVKGFREDSGEESRYVFNGLGKRVRMEQLTANPDIHYQNNSNTGGNGYGEIVEYLSMLGLAEATGKTYSNNYGLTIQQSEASTLTDYVIDYTNTVENVIMAFENDGLTMKYVYGYNGRRISQTAAYEDDEDTRVTNPNSSIAVDGIRTAYYHQNYLGSSSYMSDAKGQILYYVEYDPWGKIITDGISTGMNTAGLDDVQAYTGHSYDRILEQYYAKARMYDPVNKRFVAEDPIRSGLNWYSYCDNNPLVYIDPTGLSKIENFVQVTLRDGSKLWVSEDHVSTLKALDNILYAQQNYEKNKSYYHNMANNARDSLNGVIIGGNAELNRLLAIITGEESYQGGNSLSVTQRALELAKKEFGSSYRGVKENVDNILDDVNYVIEHSSPVMVSTDAYIAALYGAQYHSAFEPAQCSEPAQSKTGTNKSAGKTYSPANPHPTLDKTVQNSFNGGTFNEKVLTENTTFYRVYGGNSGKVGSYMTRTPQNGAMQSQIDLALDPKWGNTATNVTTVTVPKGTVIYEGTAAPQGNLLGGGNQVYIPRENLNPAWFK